jgi:chemotaxis protein MotB
MLDKSDPFNPQNRRISITVLNARAEKRILDDAPDALPTDAGGAAVAIDAANGLPASGATGVAATAVSPTPATAAAGAPPAAVPADANAIPSHLQPPTPSTPAK